MERSARKELRKRFGRMGWALILSQIVLILVVYGLEFVQSHVLMWMHPDWTFQELTRALYDSGWALVIGALCAIAPLLLLPMERPKAWMFRQERAIQPTQIVVFFLLVMGLQLTASLFMTPFEWLANVLGGSFFEASEIASAASVTPSMLFYTVLFAPLSEEIVYRGFVLHYLRPYGKTFAIVVSAILFGLMHGNVIQLPMAILCGSLFGYVAVEYSLPASIVLHSMTNMSVELIGWLSAADEIVGGAVNAALTSFGLIALFLCASNYKGDLCTYWKTNRAPKGTAICFLTSLPIVLLCVYLVVLTAKSITPL